MDLIVTTLFQEAQQSGDLKIISKDGTSFLAHSFVCIRMSQYIKSLFDFNNKAGTDLNKKLPIELVLEYDIVCLKFIFEFMHFSNCNKPNLQCNQIVELYDLIEFLQIESDKIESIKKYYLDCFKKKINKDNWLELLTNIYNKDIYINLDKSICQYFITIFINKDNIINDFDFLEFTKGILPEIQNKLINLMIGKVKSTNSFFGNFQKTQMSSNDNKNLILNFEYKQDVKLEDKVDNFLNYMKGQGITFDKGRISQMLKN